MRFKHEVIEKNSILLTVLTLLVVSIGGLVEIAPLFYLESTIEKVKGMRPYTPLELTGRAGPDLARVGGRYSDAWHVAHMDDPRSVVPESIMPGYPFLAETPLRLPDIAAHLRTNRAVGVPYSDEMVEMAAQDLAAQANPDADGASDVAARYPGAVISNFDGDAARLTELDTMIAYLQVLGTLVDFEAYRPEANYR